MKSALPLVAMALVCGAACAGSVERRGAGADASFYTTGFDGADIRFSNFNCARPVFIARSVEGARHIERSVRQWRECYARFVAKLGSVLPAGKAIPEDVAKTMSTEELARAKLRMGQVYASIAAEARKQDDQVSAAHEYWRVSTLARHAANSRTGDVVK